MKALADTCKSYRDRPRDHVVETYWTSVKHTSQNFQERKETRARYEQDIGDLIREWQTVPGPLETAELDRMKRQVDSAYRLLPSDQRRVVDLRLDERSYDSIAADLSITPETARKRFQRAKEKMKCSVRCDSRRRRPY